MRTVMHITEVLSGGVLPVIAGICNGLIDKYQFVVVYGIRFDTPNNLEDYFDPRVKLIPMPSLRLKMSLTGDLRAIRELKQCVKKEKPDVIHIHSTKAGIDARIGLLGNKIPKYYTPHGFSFLRKDQNAMKKNILRGMESTLARMCDGIIACGKTEFEEAKKITSKAFLVENGIDTTFVDASIEGVERTDHKYTVYTAGRIGPQKNPKMFNEIAKSCPNYSFVWIGDGDDRDQLTSPNIEITGVMDRKDVLKRAVNCDCYLSTSLWEGLPIALMEAMYLEKRCIVTDVNGNNELVMDGKTGMLFRTIEEACDGLKMNAKTGEAARMHVVSNYTLEKMACKYEKIYG